MEYRVVITPEAQAAIDRDIAYIRLQASPEIADRWYHGLIEAIASLSDMPKCSFPRGPRPVAECKILLLLMLWFVPGWMSWSPSPRTIERIDQSD